MILHEPASVNTTRLPYLKDLRGSANLSEELCVLGYIRADASDDYYNYLRSNKKLEIGAEFYFYYYAIRNGAVYAHHFDIAKAGLLRIFTNDITQTNTYQLEPVICSIEANELLSKADLVQRLNLLGYMTDGTHHHADFYYVMKVKVINASASRVCLRTSDVNSINGNDSFSPHSPKVLPVELVAR